MRSIRQPTVAILVDRHGRRRALPVVAWNRKEGEDGWHGLVVHEGAMVRAEDLEGFRGYESALADAPNTSADDAEDNNR